MTGWETVIGLEIHVQLATASKLFCGCPTVFGAPPNSQVCPVCLGLPGALPVPNQAAVALAVRAGLGLGCTVNPRSVFARKNYFYPDLPKGYQISQFDQPLARHGRLQIATERGAVAVGITRLHLEEDAGKLVHDRFPDATGVDLNRAGVPLAEIVSEPHLRSGAEARTFLNGLKRILEYLEVSDCNMEEGSLRVDANISVRPLGASSLGTKTEVKNLNSFANVERAVAAEAARQTALLDRGDRVEQVTLSFDADSGTVRPMRSKEESHDYRYFPDPDLPPLVLDPSWLERQRAALPELPAARRERFEAALGLSGYDAEVLTADPAIADYFEAMIAAGAPAKSAANWVQGEVLARRKEDGHLAVPPDLVAELIAMVAEGAVSGAAARTVFARLGPERESARAVAGRLGLIQVRDDQALAVWVDEVLGAHPAERQRLAAGEGKLMGFLVGQVMKASRGTADPKAVAALIKARL
ncbi:MAG: Asp-tRNA(Asn)/Glu-tRNA(Gln) amidotransferase subunit GatB [Gemmatimonadetes bacterium]|nr:Asp-tRNA(Asn)/Glu-tRNA(Gln) amidotransferase subunit GatB [Gemmatimonadota bacterium]